MKCQAIEGEACGHTPGKEVYEKEVPATCYKEGSRDEVVYCTVCSAEISREEKVIPRIQHDFSEPVQENITDSTCYAEGSYEEVVYCLVEECPCAKGGETGHVSRTTKTIEKKEHTRGQRQEDVINPTCTEAGSYVLVTYCTVEQCGEELDRENVTTDALKHSFTNYISNNDATCTADGTLTAKCDRCTETHTIVDEGSAGHPGETPEVIPPSCEADGYTNYKCTVCHEVLRKEWGEKATGHTDDDGDNLCDTCGEAICVHVWDIQYDWEIDLSDLEKPIVICRATGTCKAEDGCGRTQTATANVLGETIFVDGNAQYPTCDEDGFATFYAVFADSWLKPEEGQKNDSEYVTIPKIGHKWVSVDAVEATCTAPGHTAYEYCSNANCGEIRGEDKVIPALTHDYASVVTDPTCSTKGYTTHTCKREGCGHSYVDTYLDATGEHVYSEQRYYDRKESWKECTGCKEKYDVVARKYKVTIVDIWGNETIREDYTYGQYLWLNYSTSNVLDLEYLGWRFSDGGEAIPAYEVWTKAPINDTTTEFTVYEVSNVKGVKYGAIMMSVDYDKADSNKTMTVDLFIYVDSLADKHKPTVKLGEDELKLEKIDDSIMMWFVSIPLSAEQITQGGDNVKITVNYKDVPVKTINSVLIAYEQALDTYLKENVGDYAGGLQDEVINAMLNYGKTVQVNFENQKPSDWAFKGYTDIANYSNSTAPTQKSNDDGTFTWMGANVRFDEEYSMRYDFELAAGLIPDTATLIVKDATDKVIGTYELDVEDSDKKDEDHNRYTVVYPVPASDLAKAGTTVQMTVTLSDGTTIESPEYEYGIHAHLTYSVYLYMEYENEDGTTYHKNYVTGDDHTTGAKTKQYVDMIVSLLKLGEAVNKVEEMTSNQQ